MPHGVWYSADLAVGVGRQEFAEHDLVGVGAAHREGIAHDGPLRLAEQAQHLAEVVNQARQHEPARMPVAANRFGRLQQVLDLRQAGVGIAVVDQRVEEFQSVPQAHLAAW